MEVFLMDDDRAPPHGIFEDYLVVIAVLPDTMIDTLLDTLAHAA